MRMTLELRFLCEFHMLSPCPTYSPHTLFVIFSSTYYMLKERFFFIIKDCILEDDALVEALYVHVGVWYVLGPNLSHLPPSLARPPVCLYFFPLSLASRAHPLGMWDATFKLVFFDLLARPDFSWTLLSPHHKHTNILTYTCVCPA